MTGDDARGPLATLWAARAPRAPLPLPVPTAADRAWWDLETGAAHRPTRLRLVAAAAEERDAPWPALTASLALRVRRDGAREPYEAPLRERQRRLSRAAVAAASTLDPAWIDAVVDGVILLCELSTWCWPAHEEAFGRTGAHLPDVSAPTLDLGAGETAALLTWIDHLLGPELERAAPGIRLRIRAEAHARVVAPFLARDDWHWLGTPQDVHNWNPWILGNVITVATALVDDPAVREVAVGQALASLDTFVAALPEDGAIDEGYGYWWNGACRALEAALLADATWGGVDVSHIPALRATVDFPARMHLGGPWFVSVADGQARPPSHAPWHALFSAARALGSREAELFATARGRTGIEVATEAEGLGRLLLALTDAAWGAATPASTITPPRDLWLPSIELGIAREHHSPRGLTLTFKGGHNDEHHNHLDLGSVTVALDGCPVVVDPGRPTYTRRTFSPERYAIWTMQSAWHAVPAPRGCDQGAGREFRARDARMRVDGAVTTLAAELAEAYPPGVVASWRRSAALDREAREVRVEDEWRGTDHAERPTPQRTRWILAGAVDTEADGATVRTLDGGTARLTWSGWQLAEADVLELDDPMLTEVWGPRLTRLTLEAPADGAHASLTVREVP